MYWVSLYWESLIKVSFKEVGTHTEASGGLGALVDAHHYQHTEVGNNFAHKVDAKEPI